MANLPKPTGAFEWTQESWGLALRCPPLSEVARHCFTTRDLDLPGVRDERRDEWLALMAALESQADGRPSSLVRLRQIHGASVFVSAATGAVTQPYDDWPEADIVASRNPADVLTVRAADCVPVLLSDRNTGAAAAVHAGWRGTAAGAVQAAVRTLASSFGARPHDLVAAVGPSIGPCCYEVGGELLTKFAAHHSAHRWFQRDGHRLRLNLWTATRDQLEEAGLAPESIHVSGLCTYDHRGIFHSYRRDGARAGRLVAAIRPRTVRGTTL